MENTRDPMCNPRTNMIWGIFLLVLAVGWILNITGLVATSIWRFAGPLGLVFAGIMLVTMARR